MLRNSKRDDFMKIQSVSCHQLRAWGKFAPTNATPQICKKVELTG